MIQTYKGEVAFEVAKANLSDPAKRALRDYESLILNTLDACKATLGLRLRASSVIRDASKMLYDRLTKEGIFVASPGTVKRRYSASGKESAIKMFDDKIAWFPLVPSPSGLTYMKWSSKSRFRWGSIIRSRIDRQRKVRKA